MSFFARWLHFLLPLIVFRFVLLFMSFSARFCLTFSAHARLCFASSIRCSRHVALIMPALVISCRPFLLHDQTTSVFVFWSYRPVFPPCPNSFRSISLPILSRLNLPAILLSWLICATRILPSSFFRRHQHSDPCIMYWSDKCPVQFYFICSITLTNKARI